MTSNPAVTMLLLAGGRSRRFGADKRLAIVAGQSLVARVYGVARSVAPTWVLVAHDADAALLGPLLPGARYVTDPPNCAGPLVALAAALAMVPTAAAVVVAADLVDVDQPLLTELAAACATGTAVVVPEDQGRLQVACAGYPRAYATAAARAVAEGQRSLTGWVRGLAAEDPESVRVVPEATWRLWSATARPFRNVNVPEDLPD